MHRAGALKQKDADGNAERGSAAIFGSYGEYRRQLFRSTSLGPGGTSLDIAWQELHRLAPELFPAESSEGDMVSALYDAVQADEKGKFLCQ